MLYSNKNNHQGWGINVVRCQKMTVNGETGKLRVYQRLGTGATLLGSCGKSCNSVLEVYNRWISPNTGLPSLRGFA